MYQKVPTWFDIVELEHRMLRFWEENQVFQKLVEVRKNAERALVVPSLPS